VPELEEPPPSWGTPLWHAAMARRCEIAELLLDCGAEPNAKCLRLWLAVTQFQAESREAMIRLLRSRGATSQPYMVGESNDVIEAKRNAGRRPERGVGEDLADSAASGIDPQVSSRFDPTVLLTATERARLPQCR